MEFLDAGLPLRSKARGAPADPGYTDAGLSSRTLRVILPDSRVTSYCVALN